MTALIDAPRRGCLQRETPLGAPAITPLNVQSVSGKLYEFDGLILRLEYLGGLSGDDLSASGWTLYTTTLPQLSGHRQFRNWGAPLSNEMLTNIESVVVEIDDELTSHQQALESIERITGFSRRELTDWIQTSHTTLNSIAKSGRVPRSALAQRITNFSRLVVRLAAIYGTDQIKIRKSLETKSLNNKSALEFVLEGDYQQAATAAQRVFKPVKMMKPIQGQKFYNARMVAVEDI